MNNDEGTGHTMSETRAARVVRLMGDMNLADLWDLCEIALVSGTLPDTELAAAIRDSFSSDDDYDDFRHEIEHELGDCADDNDDCMWADVD